MAILKKTTREDTYTHKRGWGEELWIENLDDYCGKILFLEAGKRGSMHYHMKKMETMYLQDGIVDIDFIDAETGVKYIVHLYPGDSIRIPRGQAHQIIALEDSNLFEFSTKHEEEDSYRVWKGD